MSRRRIPLDPSAPWACWEYAVQESHRVKLHPRERGMWFGITRHAAWRHDRWECFPSRRRMADYIGQRVSANPAGAWREVARVLASLEAKGLIARHPQYDHRGRQTVSLITLPTIPPPSVLLGEVHGQGALFAVPDPVTVEPRQLSTGGRVGLTPTGEGGSQTHPQFLEVQEGSASKHGARQATNLPESVAPAEDACLPGAEKDNDREATVRLPGGETNWREEIPIFLAALPDRLRPAGTVRLRTLVAEALDRDWDANGLADYCTANSGPGAGPGWTMHLLAALPEPWRSDDAIRAVTTRPVWCGRCDERTRLSEDDDGRPTRCPACHPLTVTTA